MCEGVIEFFMDDVLGMTPDVPSPVTPTMPEAAKSARDSLNMAKEFAKRRGALLSKNKKTGGLGLETQAETTMKKLLGE